MKIPFKDVKVEVIGVEDKHYQRVLQVVAEIQRQGRGEELAQI